MSLPVSFGYFKFGHPPVAVADPPLPMEEQIVDVPLNARIDREYPRKAGLEATEANLTIGAHIYRQQCASCHGLYGRPADFGKTMYPSAPQLWEPHGGGVVGVSDDPPGVTYWKVKNGIRLSGMPAFRTCSERHADVAGNAVARLRRQAAATRRPRPDEAAF